MAPLSLDLEQLRQNVRGVVIAPGDPAYERGRRVWNAMIDRCPAAIVRPRSAADVIAAVNFARDHRLPLAIRGGAHSVAGASTCNDGLVIDFADMKSIHVDPRARIARAEPGLRWAEFDRETQAFGLATTGGTVGDTGIAGLTLGGGFGWLGGSFGMTVDNLRSADLVLASGALVRASEEDNPDLFWAIRGGGGNFGVVTSFEYRLHQVGPIVGGLIIHPFAAARDLMRFYRSVLAAAPDALTVAFVLLHTPDGHKACAMAVCYVGNQGDAESVVRPIKQFGTPLMDAIGPIPYTVQQSLIEAAMPPDVLNYWKADFMSELADEAIDVAVAAYERVPSPMSSLLWFPIQGVATRVAPDATAFPHRRGIHVGVYSLWTEPSHNAANVAWARDTWQALRPFASHTVYVNDLGEDESGDRMREAYVGNYDRLAAIKAKYDPENLFKLNANIKPAHGVPA